MIWKPLRRTLVPALFALGIGALVLTDMMRDPPAFYSAAAATCPPAAGTTASPTPGPDLCPPADIVERPRPPKDPPPSTAPAVGAGFDRPAPGAGDTQKLPATTGATGGSPPTSTATTTTGTTTGTTTASSTTGGSTASTATTGTTSTTTGSTGFQGGVEGTGVNTNVYEGGNGGFNTTGQ